MMYEQDTVRTLYKKLLTLYPNGFKERLGVSMEQSFNDLYNEQKRQTGQTLFGFVFWIFIETAMGIFRERLMRIGEGDAMQNILTTLRWPAIISFLIVLPFTILEVVNRRSFNEGFPIPLFVMMWLLPVLFILTGLPVMRNLRQARSSILANPVTLLIRVVFLAFLVWLWFGIVIDQMPCFLGVPNCD